MSLYVFLDKSEDTDMDEYSTGISAGIRMY